MQTKPQSGMSLAAHSYIAAVLAGGLFCLSRADWEMKHPLRFGCYMAICLLSSAMKINLPGILGTMSTNFLFVLLGILDLGSGQTILMGGLGALLQCVWKPKSRLRPIQTAFSVMNITIAVFASYAVYHWPLAQRISQDTPVLLIAASLTYFMLNTSGIAAVVALTEHKSLITTWRNCYFWSFPFYLVGASIAWVFGALTGANHSQGLLLLLPVIYAIYRSYRVYLCHLEDREKTRGRDGRAALAHN